MDFNVLTKGNVAKLEVELAQQKADKKATIKEAIEGPTKGVEKAPKAVRKAMEEPEQPKAKSITAKDVKALHKAVDEAEAKKLIPKRAECYRKVVAYKAKFPECLRGTPNHERAIEQYAEITDYFNSLGTGNMAKLSLIEGFSIFERYAHELGLLQPMHLRPGFAGVLADIIANEPKLLEPELSQFEIEMGGKFKTHWVIRGAMKIRAMWSEWSRQQGTQ